MNKVLKKILCAALPFSLGYSCSCAMDNTILPMDFVGHLLNPDYEIAFGKEAGIFHSTEYFPQYVLKLYSKKYSGYSDETSIRKQGRLSNMNCKALSLLAGKKLGENLVNVKAVNSKENYIVLEYINGKTYSEIKHNGLQNDGSNEEAKLTLDFFIDKWCIGIMQGFEQIHNITDKYLIDRHDENLMIKFISNNEPIPIIIDYDFDVKKPPLFEEFGKIFLEVMEYNINDSDKQNKRYDTLKNYITKRNKLQFLLKKEAVEKIITDLQEIKEGNDIE